MAIDLKSGIANVDEGIQLDKEMKNIQASLANRIAKNLHEKGFNVYAAS